MRKKRTLIYVLIACGVVGMLALRIWVLNRRNPAGLISRSLSQNTSLSADCITLENPNDQNDNGCKALKCASMAFASTPVPHKDTKTAADNLKACVRNGSTAIIIGHGAEGRIDTGGPNATPDKVVSHKNPINWGRFVDDLKDRDLGLTLLGCNVGDGGNNGDGIDLLKQVHEHTKPSKVRAPTGVVGCYNGQFYFEDDAIWEEVSEAGIASSPINQTKSLGFHTLTFEAEPSSIVPSDIDQIIVTTREKDFPPFPLRGDQKTAFLSNVNFAIVKKSFACPIAGTVGSAKLILKPSAKRKNNDITLEVLGNGLLRDVSQSEPNVFYQGLPTFMDTWRGFSPL